MLSRRRFAATVRYDGTDFSGSQLQPGVRTVQGELEGAASRLFGEPTRVSLAGRTDAGVHAAGQVAAFTAETRLDEGIIQRALDALLASDVAVKDLKEVDQAFDPRRWARKRWYRYTVFRAETRDPLWRRFAWHVPEPLNLEAMRRGSELFVGTKDFSACASPIGPGRTSIRTVTVANWEASGCFLRFDIEANAFLPQMVRRLVGSLVLLGRGRLRMPELERLLAERVPATLGPPAPAAGLCLERVSYEGEGQTV